MKMARLWRILRIVRRYRLRELLDGREDADWADRGRRLREALEILGPVFIKFGQALSTRPDIIPPGVATELAKLQDRVPPFAGEQARRQVEQALAQPVSEVYAEFEDEPLASASVAQVHAARMREADGSPGMQVVVKVLRPGVRQQIARDLDLLYLLARWVQRLHPEGERLRPTAVVAEFDRVIHDELDMMREGAACAQLRRNWLGSDLIYHPQVVWEATRPEVLTQERIFGVSIRELDRLRELGVDFKKLSDRGVEIFFKQVFRDNFFHADMHPGNIIVDVSDPASPRYLAIDFGIVGSLTYDDQRYLAENFLAFFNQDYRRVAELHVKSGWIPAETRIEDFEAAIRTVCEPIFGKPIKDISFGFFLLRLFQIARRFRYEVQPQLVLLQKTLLQVEGLGRQLDPELDLWKTAKPIMEDWMRQRLSPARLSQSLSRQLPLVVEALPRLAEKAVHDLEQSDQRGVSARLQRIEQQMADNQRRSRHTVTGLALVALAGAAGVAEASGFAVPGGQITAWVLGLLGVASWWRGR